MSDDLTPSPCRCDGPNMNCLRSGYPMLGRLYQLCSGTCPEGCAGQSERFRAMWDAQADSQEPGFAKKLANFGAAVVEHVRAGRPLVSQEEHDRRLALCVVNECNLYRDGTCIHPSCGCDMATKTWWQEQKCPVGRW